MKKSLLLLFISVLFLSQQSLSQTWAWSRAGNGPQYNQGWAISTDANGNSVATGAFQGSTVFGNYTLTSNGDYDVFVVKYDPNGNVLWAKSGGGTGPDQGYAICQDASGNVYVTGGFLGPSATFGSFTLSGAWDEIFMLKYDQNGNLQWAKKHGGGQNDDGKGITVDANGNIYVTGYYWSTATFYGSPNVTLSSSGWGDIFTAKFDNNGNCLWAKKGGSSGDEGGNAVAVDANGNVYSTGFFRATCNFGSGSVTAAGDDDIFLAKYDNSGTLQWVKRAGGSTGQDRGMGIGVDGSNRVYISGHYDTQGTFGSFTLNAQGGKDAFLAKYDGNGNCIWAKTGGGAVGNESGYGLKTTQAGNSWITGSFSTSATFGSYMVATGIPLDIFVVKYDSTGLVKWAAQAGGEAKDESFSVSVDGQDRAYVTGYFTDSALFGANTIYGQAFTDIFVARIDNFVGIDELSGSNIPVQIYPNPMTDQATLEIMNGKNSDYAFALYDFAGKQIYSSAITNRRTHISRNNLPSGIYFFSIEDKATHAKGYGKLIME